MTGCGRDMSLAGRINLYKGRGHVVKRGICAAGAACLLWDGMNNGMALAGVKLLKGTGPSAR